MDRSRTTFGSGPPAATPKSQRQCFRGDRFGTAVRLQLFHEAIVVLPANVRFFAAKQRGVPHRVTLVALTAGLQDGLIEVLTAGTVSSPLSSVTMISMQLRPSFFCLGNCLRVACTAAKMFSLPDVSAGMERILPNSGRISSTGLSVMN